jgi:hypothetical protein
MGFITSKARHLANRRDETTPVDPLRRGGQANGGTKPHDGGKRTGIMGHGKRYGRWCH